MATPTPKSRFISILLLILTAVGLYLIGNTIRVLYNEWQDRREANEQFVESTASPLPVPGTNITPNRIPTPSAAPTDSPSPTTSPTSSPTPSQTTPAPSSESSTMTYTQPLPKTGPGSVAVVGTGLLGAAYASFRTISASRQLKKSARSIDRV